MKLIRFGAPGSEKPGIEVEGIRYDVSNLVHDYDEDFFTDGGIEKLQKSFDTSSAMQVAADVRLDGIQQLAVYMAKQQLGQLLLIGEWQLVAK